MIPASQRENSRLNAHITPSLRNIGDDVSENQGSNNVPGNSVNAGTAGFGRKLEEEEEEGRTTTSSDSSVLQTTLIGISYQKASK